MNRRSASRLKYFLFAFVAVCGSIASIAWLLYRFPWPIHLSDFSHAKGGTFVGHWPQPAMEEELQSRKKLKRFPRSEQERRLNLKLRRMEFLSVPLFDFFLDSGTQLIAPELPAGVTSSNSIIWPSLPTDRRLGSQNNESQSIQYVVLPKPYGSQCVEGVSMSAGDELKVSVPLARNKRNVVFTVMPLTPSYLRAWLGQYSWGKQFNDSDVNRLHMVTIPINDTTATSIRMILNSGNMLISSASVSQWDRAGRLPIQLGRESVLWSLEGASEESSKDKNQSLEADGPELVQADEEELQSEQLQGEVQRESEPAVANPKKTSSQGEDLLDPNATKINRIVGVQGRTTVSLGYNVLLIQLDSILNTVMNDAEEFEALAPNLYRFAQTALAMDVSLPKYRKGAELFQHTIVRQNADYIPLKLPIITKDIISSENVFNLYQEFRNYGYRVISFAPPSALSLPVALSYGNEVPNVDGRWLDTNDWNFLVRRRELDSQPEPASGLAAIFNSERDNKQFAMNEHDFEKMAKILEGLEMHRDSVPDWKANEFAIINGKKSYLPRLIDGFHRWIEDNSQIRSLAHVYLHNDDPELRPSFKDFLTVLKLKKLKALALPGRSERFARIVMLDRVFGELMDTLIARRMYHRTAVAVLLPKKSSEQKEKTTYAQFWVGLSGLKGKKVSQEKKYSLDDALQTLAQLVGIQLRQNGKNGQIVFSGESLETENKGNEKTDQTTALDKDSPETAIKQEQSNSEGTVNPALIQLSKESMGDSLKSETDQMSQVSKFRMIILPRAAGCQPFEWRASASYFGLTASQPVIEEPVPRGKIIRVYPCGIRDQVIELSWYQTHSRFENSSDRFAASHDFFGGGLRFLNESGHSLRQDIPLFLVGPQALALDSLPLRLERFSASEVNNVFDADPGNPMEKEMLARVLNLNAQMQGAQMSAHTLVYFFREPISK
jgi:hypothetical protein